MSGVSIIDPNNFSFRPAVTNQVVRVSMPASVPAAMYVSQGTKAAVEKGMTLFDAAKTGLNIVKAENVYKSRSKVCGKINLFSGLKKMPFFR